MSKLTRQDKGFQGAFLNQNLVETSLERTKLLAVISRTLLVFSREKNKELVKGSSCCFREGIGERGEQKLRTI